MIKIADLTYYSHTDYTKPEQVLKHHEAVMGYIPFLARQNAVTVYKHLNEECELKKDDVNYVFNRKENGFFKIPFQTHLHLKKWKPDMVLVHGLIFPIPLLFLKWAVGRHCKIVLQHRGERPFSGLKLFFQRLADKVVDAYLFTSTDNAELWFKASVFHPKKCFEIINASTNLSYVNHEEAKSKLGLQDHFNYLWVGRLEKNKDPLTILHGFKLYLKNNAAAKLHLIFQEDDLLEQIQKELSNDSTLQQAVQLVGKVPHQDLNLWYSACDFYVSGSHREGSGFALIEALGGGCIPIVTSIPPFRKICGGHGLHFEAGDVNGFAQALKQSAQFSRATHSQGIKRYFNQQLTWEVVANQLLNLHQELSK